METFRIDVANLARRIKNTTYNVTYMDDILATPSGLAALAADARGVAQRIAAGAAGDDAQGVAQRIAAGDGDYVIDAIVIATAADDVALLTSLNLRFPGYIDRTIAKIAITHGHVNVFDYILQNTGIFETMELIAAPLEIGLRMTARVLDWSAQTPEFNGVCSSLIRRSVEAGHSPIFDMVHSRNPACRVRLDDILELACLAGVPSAVAAYAPGSNMSELGDFLLNAAITDHVANCIKGAVHKMFTNPTKCVHPRIGRRDHPATVAALLDAGAPPTAFALAFAALAGAGEGDSGDMSVPALAPHRLQFED